MSTTPDIKTELTGHPQFDPAVFDEAAAVLGRLPLADLSKLITINGNHPTPDHRIMVSGGVRAIGNSPWLIGAEPYGVVAALLYYFVTLCEGILMPQLLKPLVRLAELEGHKGPRAASGSYEQLKAAKKDLGPAIDFLATHGAPIFSGTGPTLLRNLIDFNADRISKFRNCVAHYRFLFHFEFVTPEEADPTLTGKVTPKHMERYRELKKIMELPGIVADDDPKFLLHPDKSLVYYEENLKRSISEKSRSRSVTDVMALVDKVERFALSASFSLLGVAAKMDANGSLKKAPCPTCNDALMYSEVVTTMTTCIACGATMPI